MVIAGSGIVSGWKLPRNRREAEAQLVDLKREVERQRVDARDCLRWARQARKRASMNPGRDGWQAAQAADDERMAGQHSRAAGALLWRVRVLEVLCG